MKKIAVIGAGNGGQAIAGYLSYLGLSVSLYDRDSKKVTELKHKGGIKLQGCINAFGRLDCVTSDLREALNSAGFVMVTTIANAHDSIAQKMAPYIEDGQIIVLNPGRTFGALTFKNALIRSGCQKFFYMAEAQTLVFACRVIENGSVNIIGIKDEVLLAALPSTDTDFILSKLNKFFPCFKKADNILRTGLENIGAILHPSVCLFNAATIERHNEFWFYRDMTSQVANFIERLDRERVSVGSEYGMKLLSVRDWIKYAYNRIEGDTLCERMKNNPAYHDIKAPGSIFARQLTEDIPTGIIPIMELGDIAGVKTPIMHSIVTICSALLEMNFSLEGRTLLNLGLSGMNKEDILAFINNG